MKLACIADDFTGATDVANNLVRAGMRVVQTIGVPAQWEATEVDAIVVALKSRTTPSADAIRESLGAYEWLSRINGSDPAPQIYFKYCSTFDSTAEGNIGPVTEALMEATGASFTIATPAFPDNGRSVFKGHLFVGDTLLSESSMRHHPLTPMTDSNLVRVMQAQCQRRVGLIEQRVVDAGVSAIQARIKTLESEGISIAIVDSIDNRSLTTLAAAVADLPLVTAGSGLAIGLPEQWGFAPSETAARLPQAGGTKAIVAGSCSTATQAQIRHFIDAGYAAQRINPLDLMQQNDVVATTLAWAKSQLASGEPILVYSTADSAAVSAIQTQLGTAQAGELVEHALAAIARGLVEMGVRQLIVAGGETSGACVQALGIEHMRIGPQIDPGVPWCHATSNVIAGQGIHLALKSGNFGSTDFFTKSFNLLSASSPA